MRDFKPLKHFISAFHDLSLFRILKRVGGQWTVGGSGQASASKSYIRIASEGS